MVTSTMWSLVLLSCSVPSRACGVNVLHGNRPTTNHSLLLYLFNIGVALGCRNHAASACAVNTFTIVHIVNLQMVCEPSPYCTGGHTFLDKSLGASPKGPDHIVGDWLSGIFISWYSKLQPCSEAQQIAPDVNCAMPTLTIFGDIWKQVQLGSWL